MTARDTFNASVASAQKTANATEQNNVQTAQVTIDAANTVVGYNLQTGNNANLIAATKKANAALTAARTAEEQAKQASITVARDALRSSGDYGSF